MATIPTDDYFSQQWHLLNTTEGEYDLDVVDVWDDYTGKGITVFVMDSGADYTNPDLTKIVLSQSYDYSNNVADPGPKNDSDLHGTAVAGIIVASANDGGVVGVAYDADYAVLRMGTTRIPYTDAYRGLEDAIGYNAAILNMSWATSFNFDLADPDGDALNGLFVTAVETGRNGLGTILVRAAGNSRDADVPADVNALLTDVTEQVVVAAVNRDGTVTEYSTPGSAILISAFGSPWAGEIVTADRVGDKGYSTTNVATNFNGTSAATPMISGIVALMLEANPDLGWRDVQTILAYSARHVGSDVGAKLPEGDELDTWQFNGATNWNGGGLHFSTDYGYGLVDALAAVRLAESWASGSTSANQIESQAILLEGQQTVPDGDLKGSVFKTKIADAMLVERVEVSFSFTAEKTDDLDVYVTGPGGERHLVAGDIARGDNGAITSLYAVTFGTQEFRGEVGKGKWTVEVIDDTSGNALAISDLSLTVYGSADSKDDTYFYNDEYSDFIGKTHSATLKDTDDGTDLLNAVMVTGDITVDLDNGKGKIDGVKIKLSGIENIDAGDGNDTLTGSKAANELMGGRGADTLTGGKGKDDFLYMRIKDSRTEEIHDLIKDFAKGDTIDLSAIDAIKSTDTDDAFSFIGNLAFSGVAGELHFEFQDLKGTKSDLTWISGDIDGDGIADFMIALTGLHTLKAGDFAL